MLIKLVYNDNKCSCMSLLEIVFLSPDKTSENQKVYKTYNNAYNCKLTKIYYFYLIFKKKKKLIFMNSVHTIFS